MNVEVVIGHHADDDEHRTAARYWVTNWYTARGYRVTTGTATGTRWCKADAFNDAVAASTADAVVLADADSFPLADALTEAVGKVARFGWAAPFHRVQRLDQAATAQLLVCDPATTDIPPDVRLEAEVHDILPGGGIVVMDRQLAVDCGPFDPRFAGYGGEDFALGNAARTFCGNYAHVSTAGVLFHLWHPRAGAMSADTKHLVNRYRLAKFDADRMRALIDEWRRHGAG